MFIETKELSMDMEGDVEIVDNEINDAGSSDSSNISSQKLKIAILGDTTKAKTVKTIFENKKTEIMVFDDADSLISWGPHLTVIALETNLLSNDTIDDKEIITSIQKVCRQTNSGILIKSICPPDTIERIQSSVEPEVFQKRIAYFPDVHDSNDIEKNLNPELIIIGGYDSSKALLSLLQNYGNLVMRSDKVHLCTPMEASFTKLAISGYIALRQTFFNQLFEAGDDYDNLNFNIVRKAFESCSFLSNNSMTIPTWIRSLHTEDLSFKKAKSYGGEYLNRDVKIFSSISDRIPIIDECVNYKNLKED